MTTWKTSIDALFIRIARTAHLYYNSGWTLNMIVSEYELGIKTLDQIKATEMAS